jgi:hypothetical protein
MEKMMIALAAIFLMFFANFMIMYARKREKGPLRIFLSTFAFLLLIPSFLLVVIVLISS